MCIREQLDQPIPEEWNFQGLNLFDVVEKGRIVFVDDKIIQKSLLGK